MGQETAITVPGRRVQETTMSPSMHAWSTSNMLEYFYCIPCDVQASLRNFLSTGDCDCLNICEENFHVYFHFACKWNNPSLLHSCVRSCGNSGKTLLPETMACGCRKILDVELQKHNGNMCGCAVRFQTLNITTDSPEFLVLFTSPEVREGPRKISILDFRTNNIFNVLTNKGKEMGEGYAVCSFQADKIPYVIISGGCGKSAGKLHKYDAVRDKWHAKVELNHSRTGHVMCASLGQIYIIGGTQSPTVEVCDMDGRNSKECVVIGTLPVAVHNMAFVVVGDKIFLFGGENSRGNVSAVQCIDSKNKNISRLKDLPCECSGGQAVFFENAVYIATQQGHMIRYDIVTGWSELCSHQPFCRKNFAMFIKDGHINILGGIRTDGKETSPCVLCKYEPKSDQWFKAATFPKPLPVYASCVVQYPKSCPIIPFSSLL